MAARNPTSRQQGVGGGGYESYFLRSQRPGHADHYVDYGLLKSTLGRFYSRRRLLLRALRDGRGKVDVDNYFPNLAENPAANDDNIDRGWYVLHDDGDRPSRPLPPPTTAGTGRYLDGREASLRLASCEMREFESLLDSELRRAADFYASRLLPDVRRHLDAKSYADASSSLLEAAAFATANAVTNGQVVIRLDAFRWTFGLGPSSPSRRRGGRGGPTTTRSSVDDADVDPVGYMLGLGGIEELEREIVVGAMERASLIDVVLGDGASTGRAAAFGTMTMADVEGLTMQVQSFRRLVENAERGSSRGWGGGGSFGIRRARTRDQLLAFLTRIVNYLLIDLQRRGLISMRGRHLKNEIEAVARWRQGKDAGRFSYYDSGDNGRDSFRRSLSEIKEENVFPLILNLVSCFLFMMNSYIIEPSSAHYAEALGSLDAAAGLMLGATPIFALMSCVFYSFWTNYNYRNPLLFAGCLQFLGNFTYANAYAYKSMELCLLGRAMTGLGAPRIINRRYVADTTPFKLRTLTSSAFAMAMAMGSAMGPGMAIVLDGVPEFQFNLPFLRTQYFNGMTGPGYFMSMNWFVYTLCIAFFFREPTRSGLEELKKREEKQYYDGVELGAMSSGSSEFDAVQRQDSLLSKGSVESNSERSGGGALDCCSCVKNMTRPVLICMSLIFMKRITLESIVGSTSIITKNRYGWTIKNVGALHLANGIIVIPVSIFSGYLSTLFEDRYMMIWFMLITLFGMAFLFDPTDLFNHDGSNTYNEGQPGAVGPHRYIAGSLIAFSGVEACESYIASLISKVVPSALAQGTFNSGLLATLVGTSGQATGDLFIFLMGSISVRNLLNLLIIPGATLVVVSILLVRWNYSLLAI